ncbi:MAG: hypothetical protein JNG83_02525 [Opitutaceae bacterium]|nr:hypothetical protein [Opitutaceae bacterium]
MRFVFIAEGKLMLKEAGREAVELESPFAREATDRATARQARHGWKQQEREAAGPFSARSTWGRQAEATGDGAPTFRHAARGAKPNELLYTLAMTASSGLFRYDLATREELRMFHRQDFDSAGLSCATADGRVVLSSRDSDGLGKLELMDEASRRRHTLTSGDGHDTEPVHHPAQPDLVYFQSAGAARNENGEIVALGPAAICRLNLASGQLETVLEDERFDLLAPRVAADGTLYYIRRPFHDRHNLPLGEKLKAFVLVPWHLAGALFGFLDAFSRLFGRQPLKPAGGPDSLPARSRFATFQGLPVHLEKVLHARGKNPDDVQLVPGSWELVRLRPDGDETIVARHVVAFDVGPDGAIVYSDGLRVWSAGNPSRLLHKGHIVQAVVII